MSLEKIKQVNIGLDNKFPRGKDPFKMISRLLEECGELAKEVNIFEGEGIKMEKHGDPDRKNLAKEVFHVVRQALQIATYYEVEEEFQEVIDETLNKFIADGWIKKPP